MGAVAIFAILLGTLIVFVSILALCLTFKERAEESDIQRTVEILVKAGERRGI